MGKQEKLFDHPAYPNIGVTSREDPFKQWSGEKSKIKKPRKPKGKAKRSPLLSSEPRYVKGLLSLDLATNTGFCCSTASGVWNLTPKKDESKGMRLIRFKGKLKELCQLEEIKMIVFEQIAVYGKYPNTVGIEMIGVLKLFCEENNIDYKAYPVKTIKIQTGNGNAGKDEMVAFARQYKPTVSSDDEADAIVLYQMAVRDLNL